MQDRRRLIVGIVSVTAGIAIMGWLMAHRDRFRTRAEESACRAGDPNVCLRLAEAYHVGEGVGQDLALGAFFENRAHEILDAHCQAGDRDACYRLGVMLRHRDRRRSSELMGRACDAGLGLACGNEQKELR